MEGLIKAGAFDSMGGRRSQYLAVLDQAMDEGTSMQKERALGQTSIFGDDTDGATRRRWRNPCPARCLRVEPGRDAEI